VSRRRRDRSIITKAQRPGTRAVAPAATFTAEQVIALAATARQLPGYARPLPRTEPPGLPFGPGLPVIPAPINAPRTDSGRPEPRLYEYPVSWNLPGTGDRLIPWRILREAADRITLFRKCIQVRKNEVSTLEWDIVVSPKAVERAQRQAPDTARATIEKQMREKVEPQIGRLVDFWEYPDRRSGHDTIAWLKKLIEERFVLDALAVYPRRTLGGDLFGFEILDGSTIKPLLDQYGYRPMPPAPAYQQILWGFPRGEFIADSGVGDEGEPLVLNGYRSDQLIYHATNPRTWTPYGYSAVEQALDDGDLWLRRSGWLKAEYTDGVMPSGWLKAGEGQADWSVDQLRAYETAFNDLFAGQTQQRQRYRLLPYGMEPDDSPGVGEKYKPDYDLLIIKLVAGHFDTTIAELGFTEPGGLGSAGWHEGQADVQDRKATQPTLADIQSFVTQISRNHLGMPRELEFKILGLESEDEDAQDEVADRRVRGARMTLNEDRDRTGLPRYTFPEADMPMIVGQRGVVFLDGASELAAPGVMIGPAQPIAEGAPAGAGQPPGQPGGQPAGPAGAGPQPKPGNQPARTGDTADAAKAELVAYRRWAARRGTPARPFEFSVLTKADLVAAGVDVVDEHVLFKAGAGGAGPKGPRRWAGWEKDLQAAQYWARRLLRALAGALRIQALVEAWTRHRGTRPANARTTQVKDTGAAKTAAKAWLDEQGVELIAALRITLHGVYVDGYYVGDRAAVVALEGVAADWGTWKPGNTAAARAVLSADGRDVGLQQLLDAADVTIKSIAANRLDEVAAVLADGLEQGLAPAEIARALRGIVDDPVWARMVALTETSRASTAATLARYRESGVPAKEWLTALDQRVCAQCAGNEDEGPVPVESVFGDGNDGPPGHPNCRCALIPAEIARDRAVSQFADLVDDDVPPGEG